jgi:hypothetical protein
MGTTTAWVDEVRIPLSILKTLPGKRGEQQNVRHHDLDAIVKIMQDTGKLPLAYGEEYKPFINVAYNGEAWVNEGNHRIMAAAKLGWKDLPVQVSYYDGGERIETGPMYPGKIGLSESMIDEAGLTYKGYPCTKDCSGHRAGYMWAVRKGVINRSDCPYRPTHPSFWEGCKSKTEGR